MGGPHSAQPFPVLIIQRAGVMTQGAVQTYTKMPGGWAYLFISWKGTLIITTMLLIPLVFFFLLSLQSHLGFFREINLWLSVTGENYLFSVCCLKTVEHFMITCFQQQQKTKGESKEAVKIPHTSVRSWLDGRASI